MCTTAIHIDIYAHLRRRELIKEGEELKRYVEQIEKELNERAAKGARGPTREIIKLTDQKSAAYHRTVNASDSYVAAIKREEAAKKSIISLEKVIARLSSKSFKTAKAEEKRVDDLANAERGLTADSTIELRQSKHLDNLVD